MDIYKIMYLKSIYKNNVTMNYQVLIN